MNMKLFLVVAVLGILTVTEGRFPKFNLDAKRITDPILAAQLNSKYQESIDEKWKQSTQIGIEKDDDTVFQSRKFRSKIRGKKMVSLFEGRTIYAYQGFRYGNADRFMPPVDVTDKFWTGTRFNATHIGAKCPQGAYVGHQAGGDEDCLFLNVYTPYKPGTDKAKNMTVMFWIYGGSFTSGDASLYMPTKLLDHDVILVTINYRLGAFGFYTRDSPEAPGNLAFYDMISALKWVNRNIEEFGGNPDLVTVFGESAGSVSANYMMLLTKNEQNGRKGKNLFRGVIAESGSALDHWALDVSKTENGTFRATEYYDHYVGCDKYDTEEEILGCMKRVPFQDLIDAGHALVREDRHNGLLGFSGCSPTLQTFDDSGLYFNNILYQEPRDFFINEDFRDTAFMTGSNREEGSFVAGIMYSDYLKPNNLTNNATYLREEMIRDLLLSIGVKDEPMSIAKSMQKSYCGDVDLANLLEAQYCLIDICGIMYLKAGSWQMANYHSYYSKYKTFYYSFEFESDDSMGAWVVASDSPFYTGITHADDLMYLFAMPAIMDEANNQKLVSQRITLAWTNFARYLDPTPDNDTKWQDLGMPKWTPYEFENPHFMLMDAEFTVQNDYSDRWKVTNTEQGHGAQSTTTTSTKKPATVDPDECVGKCAEVEDQKDAFMITMIVFIVLFVIACLIGTYFFFKARR